MKREVELAFEEWAVSEVEKEMNRRRGYAERAGEAAIRRQRAKQRKREAIGVSIAFGLTATFFWICYALWVSGNTPIFK